MLCMGLRALCRCASFCFCVPRHARASALSGFAGLVMNISHAFPIKPAASCFSVPIKRLLNLILFTGVRSGMTSFKSQPLPLDSPEECRVWLMAFEAHCRGKKLNDKPGSDGTTPQTDQFLERCGSKPLLKILSMLPGKNVTKLDFATIKKAIEDYIEPRKRLIIADRTSFLQLTQHVGENVVDFLTRINDASIHCKWDSLRSEGPNDELVKLRFHRGDS